LCSEPVKKQAREGFGHTVGEAFDSAEAASLSRASCELWLRIHSYLSSASNQVTPSQFFFYQDSTYVNFICTGLGAGFVTPVARTGLTAAKAPLWHHTQRHTIP
jgi:hypothetical protein